MSCSTRWSMNSPVTPPARAPRATDASSGGAKGPIVLDRAAHPNLSTEVAARLPHGDRAVRGMRHQDHAVDRDLRILDKRQVFCRELFKLTATGLAPLTLDG